MKVPHNWIQTTIGELFDVQLGKMLNQKAKEVTPQYEYLGNKDVQWGTFNTSNLNTMHFNEIEQKKFSLKKGDILVCEGGEVGRCAVWEDTNKIIYYQKALHRLRTLKNNVIPYYFQTYLEFMIKNTNILNRFASKTSIAHLTRTMLLKFPVLLPPLAEQEKIAEILSTWDQAIDSTEKLIANAELQKKALMQQLLTGKKRLLDENGERFSEKWEKVKLNTLCDIQTGKKDANKGSEMGLYPFFTCAVNHIYSDEYSFDCEAITIAGNGAIGTTHYYNGKFEAYQRTYVLNHFSNEINSFYLLQFINYFLHIDIQREQQRGAMPYIRVGLLQNFKVHLPTIQEQQKIAEVLSTADREIELLTEKLEYLKAEKKALMQQLLTGKRRVKVA